MLGTILGNRYELLEQVGEGGMATVYKARCRILDRIVAVKVLKEEYSRDAGFVQKFRTEAQAAARLSHPNIVNIFDVGQDNDIYFIVMEYVEGETLKDLIEKTAPLPVDKAVDIAIMICDGIHHAHEKGIIHRDIKPHNILITPSGMVKVADFGIAQAISKKTITFGGNIVGSVHYFSPEQAKGEPITRATDIYSVGCVLYEMLTGEIPFDAESPITVALKHIHDEVPSPRAINSAIPVALEGVIFKAMEKQPQHRFATVEEMRNVLLNLHSNSFSSYKKRSDSHTIIMPPVSEGKEDTMGKKKIRPLGVAIIVLGILGLLLGALFQMGGSFFGEEVVVPDIVNMDIKQANDELNQVKLKMVVVAEQNSEDVPKNHIISQKPSAGQKVKEGREIEVIVSKGQEALKVPRLIGIEVNEAELILRNEGFKPGKIDEVYDDKYAEKLVISQNPRAGSSAGPGTKIDLLISKGKAPERIPMPELIGLKVDDARRKIEESQLVIGETKRQESNQFFSDYVIDQDTAAGVLIDQGSTVNLTVSKGPGPVAQSKAISIKLPGEQNYYKVVIKLKDSQGEREVYNQTHAAGDEVYVGVSYYGNATAEVQLNGKPYRTVKL